MVSVVGGVNCHMAPICILKDFNQHFTLAHKCSKVL
jgi:hypothetical protein